MKQFIRKQKNYLFSILPLVGIIGLASIYENSNNVQTPMTKSIPAPLNTLPCGFPSGSIVGGQTPTFTPRSTPILQYPATRDISNIIANAGAYTQLVLQSDGNLCLITATQQGYKTTWDAGTNGTGADRLYFQTDGNLVLKKSSTGAVIWSSGIHSNCAGADQAYFVIQEDGNMVMRYPTGDGRAYALGDTNTASCTPTTQCGPHDTGHKHQIKN